MKYLFLSLLSIIMLSCQDHNFKTGECIQKPDQNTIWEIKDIKDSNATIIQSGSQAPEMVQEIKLNSDWIVTTCKK